MRNGREEWDEVAAGTIVDRIGTSEGRLIVVLHAIQDHFGYVPEAAVPLLADRFNLSRAEIHGTISFYHDFRSAPAGRHVLKLCRAEACQAAGARALHERLQRDLGIAWHETTPDGHLTIEPVYCLGLCATGPAALLDEEPLVRLDASSLEARLSEVAP